MVVYVGKSIKLDSSTLIKCHRKNTFPRELRPSHIERLHFGRQILFYARIEDYAASVISSINLILLKTLLNAMELQGEMLGVGGIKSLQIKLLSFFAVYITVVWGSGMSEVI